MTYHSRFANRFVDITRNTAKILFHIMVIETPRLRTWLNGFMNHS
jgi:hypothetical protein